MSSRVREGSLLIAVIGEEVSLVASKHNLCTPSFFSCNISTPQDLITGLLLTGMGYIDAGHPTNYFIADASM
jgi:hypothetical protein